MHTAATILLAVILAIGRLCAQSPTTVIDLNHINLPYLEHLVKLQVDSVRQAHGLQPLVNDAILYTAAQDHARYLRDHRKTGHFQNIPAKKTPEDRVHHYGGGPEYQVGENAISTFVHFPSSAKHAPKKTTLDRTYGEAARRMMDGWVNSPGHYANIITEKWEVTGVAIALDTAKGNLKGVQKFAQILFQYHFTEDAKLFPYSTGNYPAPAPLPPRKKYPFRLRNLDYRQAKRLVRDLHRPVPQAKNRKWDREAYKKQKAVLKAQKRNIGPLTLARDVELTINMDRSSLLHQGRSIAFRSANMDLLRKMIRRRRDGLALELVDYEPLHCGNPKYETGYRRMNENSALSGTVQYPLRYKHLFGTWNRDKRKWKKKQRREIQKVRRATDLSEAERENQIRQLKEEEFTYGAIIMELGDWPRKSEQLFSTANVLLLRKKRVAWAWHFGDDIGEPFPADTSFALLDWFSDRPYYPQPRTTTLRFVIPFRKAQTDFRERFVQPIVDSLQSENIVVTHAKIEGYASVEGTRSINERLQRERAEGIVAVIEAAQEYPFEKEITARENWDLFFEQLGKSRYASWTRLDRKTIKARLRDPNWEQRMEPLLRRQRRTDVELRGQENITEENLYQFALRDYRVALDSAALRNHRFDNWMSRALAIQHFLYQGVEAQRLPAAELMAVTLPEKEGFGRLWHNRLWMYWKYELSAAASQKWETDFFNSLRKLRKSDRGAYNLSAYYLSHWREKPPMRTWSPVKLAPFLAQAKVSGVAPPQVKAMYRMYDLKMVPYFYQLRKYMDAEIAMLKVYQTYLEEDRSVEEALEMCKFFCHYRKYDIAYRIIHPFAFVENPNHEAVILLFKIAVQHPEESPHTDYFEELLKIRSVLTKDEWCGMFMGPGNIGFQILDHAEVRAAYCAQCLEKGNHFTRLLKQ